MTDLEQLRAENARLRELLSIAVEMTGEPECWYDHHGYCQAHNLEPKGECWVELSSAILSADPAPVVDEWQPIETAPHETPVLLYCPDRGCPSNRERIELGCYSTGERVGHTSTMSYHSWATHWMPLPPPPSGENGNG